MNVIGFQSRGLRKFLFIQIVSLDEIYTFAADANFLVRVVSEFVGPFLCLNSVVLDEKMCIGLF